MNKAILIGTVLLAISFGGYRYMKTRGLRNNNPGNIRRDGRTMWQGLAATQTDPSFWQFTDPVYGIRALAKILHNYNAIYGLNTVREIISRWAPPNENDTGAYVNAVAADLGVGPDEPINVDSRMNDLVAAIIHHENGTQPYDLATVSTGVNLAVA